MAAIRRRPLAPLCTSCIRSLIDTEPRALASPFWVQARGKKKLPREQNIMVKLLVDIPGYGRKDAILSVARGRMRNLWYPDGRAAYVTHAQRKLFKDLVQERDSMFMMETEKESQPEAADDVGGVKVELLSPRRSRELLEQLVPSHIAFFRRPIAVPDATGSTPIPTSVLNEPAETAQPSAQETVAAAATPIPDESEAIFGSVTAADIAQNIKALLALEAMKGKTRDAARIVLAPEDIAILPSETQSEHVDDTKIKGLGDYDVELRIQGEDAVRRTVRVAAELGG